MENLKNTIINGLAAEINTVEQLLISASNVGDVVGVLQLKYRLDELRERLRRQTAQQKLITKRLEGRTPPNYNDINFGTPHFNEKV